MRFVADCMLGKLAKWLKILGFDVVYLNKAEDRDLLQLAKREKRVLLTKDHLLRERARDIRAVLVESERWPEQVEQVLGELDLWQTADPYSRCIQCNVRLKNLPKKKAKNLVAPFVYEKASSFAVCPACGRVFWPGTHFGDMAFKIEKILRKRKGLRKKAKGLEGKRRSRSS